MKRLFKKFFPVRRRGSALVAVVILTSLVLFGLVSLSAYAMHRRMDAVRLTLHSAELAAAENALERSYALLFFASQRRPAQIRLGDPTGGNPIGRFVDEVVNRSGAPETNEGFEVDVVTIPIPLLDDSGSPVTGGIIKVGQRQVDDFGIELAPWMDFDMQISGWQVIAGARARDVRDTDGILAFPFQSFLQRPGVYAAKNLVQYSVPLLNYAIFYENEFELDAGARIDVRGKVHTNSDWYLTSSSSAYYHDNITVAGNLYAGVYHYTDHGRRSWSGSNEVFVADKPLKGADPKIKLHDTKRDYNNGWLSSYLYNNTKGGKPKLVSGKPDWSPNPEWKDQSQALFGDYIRDSSHGIKPIQLPIDEQESPRLLIEAPLPPNGNYANEADAVNDGKLNVNLAYKAGVVIETKPGFVTASASDWKNYVEAYRWIPSNDPITGAPSFVKEPVSFEYQRVKAGSKPPVLETISLVDRVTIYNGREEKNITMVDFKADRYAEFLKLHKNYLDAPTGTIPNPNVNEGLGQTVPLPIGGNPSEAGIVYFNVSQEGLAANQQAAARLSNAIYKNLLDINTYSQRADGKAGLTFATNAPMYTLGHVNHDAANANNRIPLMIAGDSINILSSLFKDSDYATGTGNGPNKAAGATTTNAVFVSGNVPSKSGQYSGGGENFYRYLEGWGGKTHTFRGSMLNLFESQVAKASWDKDAGNGVNSGYYGAPNRNWLWDTRFSDAGNAPPGIPTSFNVTKGRWQLVGQGYFLESGGSDALAVNK